MKHKNLLKSDFIVEIAIGANELKIALMSLKNGGFDEYWYFNYHYHKVKDQAEKSMMKLSILDALSEASKMVDEVRSLGIDIEAKLHLDGNLGVAEYVSNERHRELKKACKTEADLEYAIRACSRGRMLLAANALGLELSEKAYGWMVRSVLFEGADKEFADRMWRDGELLHFLQLNRPSGMSLNSLMGYLSEKQLSLSKLHMERVELMVSNLGMPTDGSFKQTIKAL